MSAALTRRSALRVLGTAALGAGAVSLSGCTGEASKGAVSGASGTAPAPPPPGAVAHTTPPPVSVASGGASSASLTASGSLFGQAPTVVVATSEAADVLAIAASTAVALGIPCLFTGSALEAEFERLGTERIIVVPARGDLATANRDVMRGPRSAEELARLTGTPAVAREVTPEGLVDAVAALDRDANPAVLLTLSTPTAPPSAPSATVSSPTDGEGSIEPITGLPIRELTAPAALGLWASDAAPEDVAAVATVRAAAVPVARATAGDPRADHRVITALRKDAAAGVIAIGAAFGAVEQVTARLRTARVAKELPGGGGLLPFPARRMVALYGHPSTGVLGMLGEQNLERTIKRVRDLVEEYAELSDLPVIPAFEIIASVATGSAGKDGMYSAKTAIAELEPWVDAAEEAGIYVTLDLQPGRNHFLSQAKFYEPLLRRPWVGLALDPEWRLKPDQVHMRQIGSVAASEINEVSEWLAALVREHDLPPKVLTLHQFQTRMIQDRDELDVSHDELQLLVHVDGSGGQGAKQDTWRAIRSGLQPEVFLGWKNFEDEDFPMLTVKGTMTRVDPIPSFISYQ